MPTVLIDGVEHYHEVHGSGVPVLLLHGGFCSLEVMRPQIGFLAERYRVYAPERRGHGRTPDTDGPYSYAQSVGDTLAYMDAVGLDDAHIVGFSDGAIIGLLMALEHPTRLRSLVAVSANLHPSAYIGGDAVDWPSAQVMTPDRTRDHHRELSPDGPDHGDIVFEKVRTLWLTEPNIDPAQLNGIAAPTLIVAGDRDVIRADHTRTIATSIPGGRLCIVPGAGHGLMEDRADFVDYVIDDFLREACEELNT